MATSKYSRLDPAARRDQILDAANALFAERAYDEVSVEDIANAAGVTRGLVHHYFGGRKDVYVGLLERIAAQREDELRRPVGRTVHDNPVACGCRLVGWSLRGMTVSAAGRSVRPDPPRRRAPWPR